MAGRKGRSGGNGYKPAHIHLVEGTHRPDRHGSTDSARKELAQRKAERMPSPPSWMPDVAKREWRRLAPILHGRGTLGPGDRGALTTYCRAYAQMVEAQKSIDADGLVLTGADGNVKANPAVHAANSAASQVLRSSVEFGLTPFSRSRVEKPVEEPKAEGFDGFADRKDAGAKP